MNQRKSIPYFQGLRGLACILVFISHCTLVKNRYGLSATMWLGSFGVEIFILLSGFLLMLQHENETLDFRDLIKKRLSKIMLLHIVTLFLTIPFSLKEILSLDIKAILTLFFNLLLLHAWVPNTAFYFSFNMVSWYLCLVLFFAAVSPIVLKIARSLSALKSGAVCIGIILFEFVLAILVQQMSIAHWILYICPIVRLGDFFIGALAYNLFKGIKNSKFTISYHKIAYCGLIIACGVSFFSLFSDSEIFSVAVWIIPVILILIGLVKGNSHTLSLLFNNSFLIFMGRISFEFFLIHQIVIRYIKLISSYIQYEGVLIYLPAFVISIIFCIMWQKISTRIKKGRF